MALRDKFYPWANSLPRRPAVALATLFGLGKLAAPGTWGSAAGILLYPFLFKDLPSGVYLIAAVVLAYVAVGVCDSAERHLNMKDPGMINLDEFVAMPFCFFTTLGVYNLWGLMLGFALFRLFDISKPLFVNRLQSLEGGLGCVADDIAAGILSAVCLNAIAWCVPNILM